MSNSETMDRKIGFDPASEDSLWRQYYGARPYTPSGTLYDDFDRPMATASKLSPTTRCSPPTMPSLVSLSKLAV